MLTVKLEERPMRVNHKIFRRWENRLSGKYYLAYITHDLFGSWNVVKAWGRVGEKMGGLKSMPCQSWEEAVDMFIVTHKKRLQSGYQAVCTGL